MQGQETHVGTDLFPYDLHPCKELGKEVGGAVDGVLGIPGRALGELVKEVAGHLCMFCMNGRIKPCSWTHGMDRTNGW